MFFKLTCDINPLSRLIHVLSDKLLSRAVEDKTNNQDSQNVEKSQEIREFPQ